MSLILPAAQKLLVASYVPAAKDPARHVGLGLRHSIYNAASSSNDRRPSSSGRIVFWDPKSCPA